MIQSKQFKLAKEQTKLTKYFVYFLLFIFPSVSIADVISSLSPGQLQQQLRNTVNIQQAVSASRSAITPIAVPIRPVISVPPSMRRPFVLRSMCITGSTVYSQASLLAFFQPYFNTRISYKELKKIK